MKPIRAIKVKTKEEEELCEFRENHDLDLIAAEIGLANKTVKLLYDLLDEFYQL
jgi:hypothetical protein